MKTKEEKQKIIEAIERMANMSGSSHLKPALTNFAEAIIGEPLVEKPVFEIKPGEIWSCPDKLGGGPVVVLKQPDGLFYVSHFDGRFGENPLMDGALSWVPQPYKTVCDIFQSRGFKLIGKVIAQIDIPAPQ